MSDDLSKAFPIDYPNNHHGWDSERLTRFREALMRERDPVGKYQTEPSPLIATPHDRIVQPECWLAQHLGNSADWTANGRLGGWRK
jgi:hypothetical protein